MRNAPSYELSYIQSYDTNNTEQTLAGYFLQKGHHLLEKTLPQKQDFYRVLEVGAGSGHHFPCVTHDFHKYVMTDESSAMLEMASKKFLNQLASGVLEIEMQDATALTYPDNSFDRLIATHVLEHLPHPVNVLGEWNRVVRENGIISIVLPCDPGMLWRLGRHFGPRRNAKKLGIAYDYLQAAEHINSIYNLVVFLRHHFENISEFWYPTRIPTPDLNLFYICHLRASASQGVKNE